MSGNINLRNLAVRSRGKIRHHVALNRQYLPVLFRCPVRRLPGLPLTEKGPQPEYGGSISGRRASYSLLMERHGVMSFARAEGINPPLELAFQLKNNCSETLATHCLH